MSDFDHEGREPEDTGEAENILREALGDEVVDEIKEEANAEKEDQ